MITFNVDSPLTVGGVLNPLPDGHYGCRAERIRRLQPTVTRDGSGHYL